jgi:hypothetical protein
MLFPEHIWVEAAGGPGMFCWIVGMLAHRAPVRQIGILDRR